GKRQTAKSEWRKHCTCSKNTTSRLGSRRIGSKGSCPSLSARDLWQSGGDLISAKYRYRHVSVAETDTERVSRTMTRNVDQVEVNGWNNEHIRSITCYCANPRALALRPSAIEPHRHSRLEGAHVPLR